MVGSKLIIWTLVHHHFSVTYRDGSCAAALLKKLANWRSKHTTKTTLGYKRPLPLHTITN